ncbi:hypothetical protein R1flu_026912 [Riccia fluitans]|uniref:Uncharacterized protein n=1 Tax=Riccia fluitans TaxID=41844 RepID=A0ABD1XHW0_9MARC
MASGSYRREGKSPELSELPEEGELISQQQQQHRAPKAHQTVLPFVEPPIPRPSKYKEFGLPKPKKELSIKIMEQFIVFRGQKKVFGASGVAKSMAIISLALHSISRASLLQDSEATWSCRHLEERDPTDTSRVASVHPNS